MFGGRGILRAQSAEVIEPNRLYVNSYLSAFFLQESGATSLTKDYGISTNVTLGLYHNFEVYAHLRPYQDDQRNVWGAPGDTQIGFKYHTPFSNSIVHTGLRFFLNMPTGRDFPIAFEPFSSGKPGIAGMGLLTIDFTEVVSVLPLKTHFNFGYFDQNIHDQFFLDQEDQYLLAAGMKFPLRSFIVFAEYSAEVFAKNQYITDYRMNSQRMTQGIKFLGPWNLIYDFAFDVSLSSSPGNEKNEFRKEYADWKLIFGLNYPFAIQKTTHKKHFPQNLGNHSSSDEKYRYQRENFKDSMQEIEASLNAKKLEKKQTTDTDNDAQDN
ncbi:MAG: hypothetical protein DWQ10_10380 [Calditrichaeota bacterium]|nr:MAG: hypothetical protein DWQ10_10380 [Calditrichota bacterium]